MADETLRFDIIGKDDASGAFSRVGAAAGELSRKMDIAARTTAVLDEALKRQRTAAGVAADATLALAKADQILAEEAKKPIPLTVLTDDAKRKMLDIQVRAEKMKRDFPELTLQIDTETVKRKLAVIDAEAKVTADKINSRLSGGGGGWGKIGALFSGGAGAASGGGTIMSGLPLVGGLSPGVVAGGAAAAAVAAPFIAQVGGAGLIGGLGAGLAGLGILGAVGTGKAGPTAQQTTAAQSGLTAAQDRQIAAQDNLNKLQASGKTTATQLASAQAALASATGSVATAQDKLNKLQDATTQTAGQQKVRQAFSGLSDSAQASLAKIGVSFQPVMLSIAATAQSVLGKLTPVFAGAAKTISGPFQAFGDALLKAFGSPAVQKAIGDVATAFGAILKAVTPGLAAGVGQIATGVSKLAGAVTANPKAFSDFIGFLFAAAGGALTAIASLTRFASYMEAHFIPVFDGARHEISHVWADIASNTNDVWKSIWATTIGKAIQGAHNLEDGYNTIRHFIANSLDLIRAGTITAWNSLWNNTVSRAARGFHDVAGWFDTGRHNIAHTWDLIRHDAASAWDQIWNNTVGRVQRGVGDVIHWTGTLPGRITGIVGNAGNVLFNWGKGVIQGLLNGMQNIIGSVWDFIKAIPGKILSFLGIHSPPQWAIDAGKHIMNGLGIGMQQSRDALKQATTGLIAATQASAARIGAGGPFAQLPAASGSAAQAQAYARGLLGGFGWGADQWPPLLALWNQESGWNANAVNPSSGAYGIPQALGHGHPYNLGDYVNQVIWGLNYIQGRYGSPGAAWAHEVANNWYAGGTSSAAPGWAWVGEHGPELMRFRGGEQIGPVAGYGRGGGTQTIIIKVDPAVAASTPDRQLGRHIAEQLTPFIKSGGRIYPPGTTPR